MALAHPQAGDPIDIQPFGHALCDEKTVALFKSDQLEVMRLVLPAGSHLPPHRVPGEITIQCIEGRIEVSAMGRSRLLAAGQLLFLQGGVVHDLKALADSSALVTIVLRR